MKSRYLFLTFNNLYFIKDNDNIKLNILFYLIDIL